MVSCTGVRSFFEYRFPKANGNTTTIRKNEYSQFGVADIRPRTDGRKKHVGADVDRPLRTENFFPSVDSILTGHKPVHLSAYDEQISEYMDRRGHKNPVGQTDIVHSSEDCPPGWVIRLPRPSNQYWPDTSPSARIFVKNDTFPYIQEKVIFHKENIIFGQKCERTGKNCTSGVVLPSNRTDFARPSVRDLMTAIRNFVSFICIRYLFVNHFQLYAKYAI